MTDITIVTPTHVSYEVQETRTEKLLVFVRLKLLWLNFPKLWRAVLNNTLLSTYLRKFLCVFQELSLCWLCSGDDKSCSMNMTFYKTDTSVHKCSSIRIDEFQCRIRLSLTFCGFVLHIFTNLWGHPQEQKYHTQTLQQIGASEMFDNSNRCLSHTVQCSRRWK